MKIWGAVEADLDAFSAFFAGGAAEGYWMLSGEWSVQGRHLGLAFKLLEVRGRIPGRGRWKISKLV